MTNAALPVRSTSIRLLHPSTVRGSAPPFEHDVDLVVHMRLLAVGLRRDEHVDADLEPGRLVDDLVPASSLLEPAPGRFDVRARPSRA